MSEHVFQHVFCPVDGSDSSLRALDVAAGMAAGSGVKLTVATVLDLGQLDFYDGIWLTAKQVESWQEKLKGETLARARERLEARGVAAELLMLRGPVVATLLDSAREHAADVIVVGRSGKGAMERLAHGSVSRRVTALSAVPVLTVP